MRCESLGTIRDESVPKTVINNNTVNIFKTAVSILVISNHDSFRVLFDKISSVYINLYSPKIR